MWICEHKIYKNRSIWKLVYNQYKTTLYYLSDNNIALAWIPGHKQIQRCEKADTLAKEAIQKGLNCRILLPSSDYKQELNTGLLREWNSNWNEYIKTHAKYYGKIQPYIQNKHWSTKNIIPRKITTLFIQLRLGTC